ncbi:MAG: four helix bundle protein [Terriglobia bacterium]
MKNGTIQNGAWQLVTSEDLKARTKSFALRIIMLVDAVPRRVAGQVISKQLLRAATSVGANYRAACRAQSRADFAAKLSIVVEEADESVYWLELLRESSLVKPERLERLLKEANELVAIAVASRKTAKGGGLRISSGPSRPIANRPSKIVNLPDGQE